MFDHLPISSVPMPDRLDPFAELRRLLEEETEAMISAARLLAGPRGERLVLEIQDDLSDQTRMRRRTVRALVNLLDILELRHVDDDSRAEAGFFAAIDPSDPCVEEICLLTDKLRDAIDRADLDHLPASRRAAA